MSGWKETEIGRIPDSWNMENFGSLLKEGVRNGIYKSKEFHGYGSRIVNMGELFEYPRIGNQKMKKVFLTETEKKKSLLKKGDLLFARRSLTIEGAGKCVIVEESDGNLSFESSIIRARPNSNIANSDYLFYLFNSRIGKYLLGSILRVVAVAGITGSDLMDLEVPLPPVDEQKQIANTLSIPDQKITLLRQQNQTLEELAQTLFKRWFVEFEFPDENGRPYKSSGGKMVESELGEIPEGWRVGNLGEFSSLKSGYAFKSNDFVENSSVKAIKIKDLKGNGVVDISNASSIDSQVTNIDRVKYFKLKEGDIVLAMSGNTTGKIGIIPPHKNGLYLNQRVGKFFLKNLTFRSFVYNFLMSGNYEERILSMGYGSAQPNINPKQIEEIETLIPNEKVLADFTKISDPIYIKTLVNSNEIQTLTQLRDTLLPKLMSGEVRVKIE